MFGTSGNIEALHTYLALLINKGIPNEIDSF